MHQPSPRQSRMAVPSISPRHRGQPPQGRGHPRLPRPVSGPRRGLDRVPATIRSARPRQEWARRPGRRRSPRLPPAPRPPAARCRQVARVRPARVLSVVPVPATQHGRAVRGQVVRGLVRAACRRGQSEAGADSARVVRVAVPAVRGAAVTAPALPVLVPVQAAVPAAVPVGAPAVRAAVAVPAAALVAPGQGWPRPVQVRAVVAAAARPAHSGGQEAGPRAAGSRRSSGARSSTTCRRRRSAACRSRAATAR